MGLVTTLNYAERPYFIHDTENHMDMDLMTYSMYSLANKDPEAFKNETLLNELINKVFQTFFQHFVSTNASLTALHGLFK